MVKKESDQRKVDMADGIFLALLAAGASNELTFREIAHNAFVATEAFEQAREEYIENVL